MNIKLVEYVNEHWYKVADEKGVPRYIPSVTTKLSIKEKPFLGRWRGDIGNREADLRLYDAQQKGKRIHWAWETALKGGCVIFDPWQAPVYNEKQISDLRETYKGNLAILRTQDEMLHIHRLKQQFDILKPEVIEVERTVYDLENNDAGTIDHVYKIKEGVYAISGAKPIHLDEGVYVGDLKTGNVVEDDVWLQIAPYLVMYEKLTGLTVVGGLVSHTGAKTTRGIAGLSTMVRSRQVIIDEDYPDYRRASDLWMRDHKDDQPERYELPSLITLKGETNGIQ